MNGILLELVDDITAEDETLRVSGTVTADHAPGYEFRLDDELLRIRALVPAPVTGDISDRRFVGRDRRHWIVDRGLEGSAAAPHDAGTSVDGVSDAFASADSATPPGPFADGGSGSTPTLAQVLAQGNDTGGVGIVNAAPINTNADASLFANAAGGSGDAYASTTAQVTGSGVALASSEATSTGGDADAHILASSTDGNATATTTATSVDGQADASANATASGTGGANVSRQASSRPAIGGGADAAATATDTDTGAIAYQHVSVGFGPVAYADTLAQATTGAVASIMADTAPGTGDANADVTASSGGGNASASTSATTSGAGNATATTTATSVDGQADASLSATASGAGNATATATATASGGSASIGPIANSTRAEIQVNGLPLITTGTGAPGGTFVSLFYVDTTAVTGGLYIWDFVAGAYQAAFV